ncbi:Two-component sensor histidine kinase, contains HisKA and HATPase domains [Chitinophaga sp. CF118]|uniref:tetratricopeptide repeat-containing sensor histidine kinase n=1 Tax=Chitinophaga sp. CF118 TaxID=1884367 RepID=UPI0008EAE477|nr:histidine kinase dimerization/phosphoacceptor domain -containing protein [Chitinophaga sp. CF118]SFE67133.1 Two-component sensor histidine kinase, contains HisKA and HATPase domains [Chitinophaga sp. CF118]
MNPLYKEISLKFIIYFFIVALVVIPFKAASQDVSDYLKVDSLIGQLKKSKPDSNRVRLLINVSLNYLSKNELNREEYDELFTYLQHAIILCDSLGLNFVRWKVQVLHMMGAALVFDNKVARGKSVFMELVKNAHLAGDRKREGDSWVWYAEAFWRYDRMRTFKQEAETAYINAISIYREIKDQQADIDKTLDLGALYGCNDEYNKAEQQFLAAIKKSEQFNSYMLPTIYYQLSVANRYMANYNKALGYALHALKCIEVTKDSSAIGDCYGELAELYQALDKPAESVAWYKKCIGKRELAEGYPAFGLYRTYGLLIVQLIKSGAIKEAMAITKDLQKRRPPKTLAESAALFQNMAYCYNAYNIYDSTERYFLKSIATFNLANQVHAMDDEFVSMARFDIAHFYVKHRQFKKARPYLNMLLLSPNSMNVSVLADAAFLMFKVDSASGNYRASIKYFQQYKTLTDSIFNEKKSRQIAQLQIEYETEKKDQEIGHLTKKGQLQQANLKQANIIRNWITASAVLLILLLAVGYNRYRFKQKTNKKLEAQQVVINRKNISLLHLVNEKEWLVKEIHHRVKNNFHIVMGLLGTQSGYLKNDEAIAAIKESQQRIYAMSLIHQKLYQSENLSSIDMPGYINELVDSLKESFDKRASLQFHLQIDRINLELTYVIPVGLILNEAITNVFKYAFPDKVQGNVYILFNHSNDDHRMVLTVKDDGIGLPASFNGNSQSSMGLNLMKGLSEDIDGNFTMQSNNGTIVTVSFVYNPGQSKDFFSSAPNPNFNV